LPKFSGLTIDIQHMWEKQLDFGNPMEKAQWSQIFDPICMAS